MTIGWASSPTKGIIASRISCSIRTPPLSLRFFFCQPQFQQAAPSQAAVMLAAQVTGVRLARAVGALVAQLQALTTEGPATPGVGVVLLAPQESLVATMAQAPGDHIAPLTKMALFLH